MHLTAFVLATAAVLAGLSAQQAVLLIAGPGASFAVELLSKAAAPAWLKSTLAFALSALAGVVSTVVYAPGEAWTTYAAAIGEAWVLAIVTHYSGATGWLQDLTAPFGLGTVRPPADVVPRTVPRTPNLPAL